MKKICARFFRGVLVLLSLLPLKFHYFLADIFAWIIKKVVKYRTDVIYVNLARSFPQLKYHEIKKIANDYYTHLGEIIAEFIWFSGSSYKKLHDSGIVTVMNPEEVSDLYDASSSMTILSTHCGNWELMGGLLGYRTATGGKIRFGEEVIHVVYKKLSSDISDYIFTRNRVAPLEKVGIECEIESNKILRYAIANKDKKMIYIYPTDQAPYWKAGKHDIGEFMCQPTNTMMGGAVVAHKLGHAIVYMKMKRVERGKYEMSLIPICQDASKVQPEEIMRKYYDLLQEELRETPANWLWSHKRWK